MVENLIPEICQLCSSKKIIFPLYVYLFFLAVCYEIYCMKIYFRGAGKMFHYSMKKEFLLTHEMHKLFQVFFYNFI